MESELRSIELKRNCHNLLYIILSIVGLVCLSFLIVPLVPPGVDWSIAFRPAALEMLPFRSPFHVAGYFNPPWLH